jgi:D-mannonate dehydratase
MIQPTKEELRTALSNAYNEIIKLQGEIEKLENAKIPRWAYNFQGKEWVVCNPFNSQFSGSVCVIQNNYPVVVASISPKDELIIVRNAKED